MVKKPLRWFGSALVLLGMLAAGLRAEASLGWQWMSPLPQGNVLNDAWGSSPQDIFAVGELGTILHFNGSLWSLHSSGTWYTLHGVWGSGPGNVWVVGNAGLILHWDGSGLSQVSSGTTWALYGIWGTGAGNIYAVGEYGTIVRFNGSNWTPITHGLTTQHLYGIWGSSASDIFVVGGTTLGGGVVLHSNGSSWTDQSSLLPSYNQPLRAVWGTGAGNVYAVGGAFIAGLEGPGTIIHSTGGSWTDLDPYPEFYLADVWGASGSDLFAVGDSGTIMRNDGNGWTTEDLGLGDFFTFYAVWGTGTGDVYAFGSRGLIWHFNGSSWSEISAGFKDNIVALWGAGSDNLHAIRRASSSTGYVTGYHLEHYDGFAWTTLRDDSKYSELNALWGSGPDDVWAVGGNGQWALIRHFTGGSWTAIDTTYFARDMYAVWGTGPDNIYAAGDLYIIHYGGSSWTTVFNGAYQFRGLWGSGISDIYAADQGGKIVHYDGDSWQEVAVAGDQLSGLRGCGPGNVYAVGKNGTLLHSTGNVSTWNQVAGIDPQYHFEDVWCAANGEVWVVGNGYGTILHRDETGWSEEYHSSMVLLGLWGNAADDVYAVGRYGTILRYGELPLIFQDGFESGDTTAWSAALQ